MQIVFFDFFLTSVGWENRILIFNVLFLLHVVLFQLKDGQSLHCPSAYYLSVPFAACYTCSVLWHPVTAELLFSRSVHVREQGLRLEPMPDLVLRTLF